MRGTKAKRMRKYYGVGKERRYAKYGGTVVCVGPRKDYQMAKRFLAR